MTIFSNRNLFLANLAFAGLGFYNHNAFMVGWNLAFAIWCGTDWFFETQLRVIRGVK